MRRFGRKMAVLGMCVTALSACGGSTSQQTSAEYPVMTAELSDVTLQTSYSASIQGRQDISIYPQVSGTITAVKITEGQKVKKGQVLFVIDQVPYQAAYDAAEANYKAAKVSLESAQLTYDSDVKLHEKQVISDYELTQSLNSLNSAKASVATMEAQLVSAKNNLSYTEVKSPADGVAGTIPYRVGALVSSAISSPLTTVADNSVMYVYFSINENAALNLIQQYGSLDKAIENMPDVQLKLNDGTIYNHTGRVASMSGVVNTSTGAVQLRAEFDNPDKILLSGGNGSVIMPDYYKDVIVIPQAATSQLQDKYFVYKIVDGVTLQTEVQIVAKNDGTNYIVTDGLEVGDKFVASGAGLLRSGIAVIEKVEE